MTSHEGMSRGERIAELDAEYKRLYAIPSNRRTPEQDERLTACYSERSELSRLEHDQLSGAEVPGFHARTVIDDTIGKLFALRQQLRVPLPEELAGLLDDIEELVERAVDVAYDEDAPEIDNGDELPVTPAYLWRDQRCRLSPSASNVVTFCSCGSPCLPVSWKGA